MGSSDQVPPFYICPISLEVMKDPVTLSTGMTYDRDSIRRWISVYGHRTCPVTQQPIAGGLAGVTPNSTLLRLIQQWHVEHPNKAMAPSATRDFAPTFDASIMPKLVLETKQPHSSGKALKKIRLLIQENDVNRKCLEESDDHGLVYSIASLIAETEQLHGSFASPCPPTLMEEAMNVLYLLKPSNEVMKKIGEDGEGKIVVSLSLVLQRGRYQARTYAALLLKHFFKVVGERYKSELRPELFDAMVEILKDQNSSKATMAVLSILMELTQYQRNQIKAIEAGVVAVLIELLAESDERRSCELMLGALKALCSRAEGRAAFGAHAAGVAAVVGKILTVSRAASEVGVKVLLQVCRFCVEGGVVDEMVEVGGVARLCMVLVRADCSSKTRDKAKKILALHFKTWSKSPCFASFYMLP